MRAADYSKRCPGGSMGPAGNSKSVCTVPDQREGVFVNSKPFFFTLQQSADLVPNQTFYSEGKKKPAEKSGAASSLVQGLGLSDYLKLLSWTALTLTVTV